jgi:hypothetical protein
MAATWCGLNQLSIPTKEPLDPCTMTVVTSRHLTVQLHVMCSSAFDAAAHCHFNAVQMVLCTNGTLLSTSYYSERRGRSGSPTRFLPVRFPFPGGIATIAVGAGHTVVVTKDGKVWTFGNNRSGQLGREGADRTAQVVRLPERIVRVAAGEGEGLPRSLL